MDLLWFAFFSDGLSQVLETASGIRKETDAVEFQKNAKNTWNQQVSIKVVKELIHCGHRDTYLDTI